MHKQNIYDACKHLLNQKIAELNAILNDLTDGMANDTKSSAGDKHETARAMMQMEQEKIGRQLQEVIAQMESLQKININIKSSKVIKGSLVKTDRGYLFLSVAIGKINADGNTVIVLSPQSPLGRQLTGLSANNVAEINGICYLIEEVF